MGHSSASTFVALEIEFWGLLSQCFVAVNLKLSLSQGSSTCFGPLLYTTHNTYTFTYACRIITTTLLRRVTQFLEKYTSHFIERVMCERKLENRTDTY